MINHVYNINQQDTTKNYRENIYVKTETKILDNTLNPNNLLICSVKRHLHNDSAILTINYNHTTDDKLLIGIFINNKPLPLSKLFTNKINFSVITGLNKVPKFEFEEINHIAITIYKVVNNKMHEYLHSHIELRHLNINKTFNLLDSNQTIDIPIELEFEFYSGNYEIINDDKCIKNIKYARLFFIPETLKQYSHISTIYYLAANIIDKNNKISKIPVSNFSNISAKVLSLPDIKETIDCNFNLSIKNKQIDQYDIIGSFTLNTHTYFDYSKKITVQGFNSYSKDGYILPFNFKGIFNPILIVSINNKYKNIILSKTFNIKKPLLDEVNGSIKLEIKENTKISNRLNWMIFDNNAILNIIENQYNLEELIAISKENLKEFEEPLN